jgi:hypothetical protein
LLENEWDKNLETVRPDTVADAVRDALEQYPDKRLIAHFMQPHYPFIGETGKHIEQGGISTSEDNSTSDSDIWTKMQFGLSGASVDVVWDAYRENLNIVLNEVSSLIKEIDGETVITSDHGNMIGERARPIPVKTWGHPRNLYTPELIDIPWLAINGEKREIKEDPPQETQSIEYETVKNRLTDLGYK